MDTKKKIALVVASCAILLSGCTAQTVDLTPFAQCLTNNGAVMYGAFWCPHCLDQKKMFGPAWSQIKFVECDPRGQNANPELCEQHNIKGFPTWEVNNKQLQGGLLGLDELSKATNCPLPALPIQETVTAQ